MADEDALKYYYEHLFPYGTFTKWLAYGDSDTSKRGRLMRREMSMTLPGDVYIRYVSVSDGADLKDKLSKRVPIKIDVGAMYNYPPADHARLPAGVFQPQERELVFDIDMTDYDPVRTCCSGAAICSRCWPFMTVAVKVLDRSMRQEFGFKHLLWVYSGRRGIHLWIGDKRARQLSVDVRTRIGNYLHLVTGGDDNAHKVKFGNDRNRNFALHPSHAAVYSEILRPAFSDLILDKQKMLDSPENWTKITSLLPDQTLRENLEKEWHSTEASGRARWLQLVKSVEKLQQQQGKNVDKVLRTTIEEIVFTFLYPRLDIHVSQQMNHLLKAPFCVHPKTGRVCVPIDPDLVDEFTPETVPTLQQLIDEINEWDAADKPATKAAVEKTSLLPSLRVMRRFVIAAVRDTMLEEREDAENDDPMDW